MRDLWLKLRVKVVKDWPIAIAFVLIALTLAINLALVLTFDFWHVAIYVAAASVIILLGLESERTRAIVFSIILSLPLIGDRIADWIKVRNWERERDKVVSNMNVMLAAFKLTTEPIKIFGAVSVQLAACPVLDACCEEFVEVLKLPEAVLQILYLAHLEEGSDQLEELWTKASPSDKHELAKILEKSWAGDRFDARPDMVDGLNLILQHLGEFCLEKIHNEMDCLVKLWNNLNKYTDRLNASSKAFGEFSGSFSPTELMQFLKGLPSDAAAAEEGLLKAGEFWFSQWGKNLFPKSVLDSMARVSLGIVAAEMPYGVFPKLPTLPQRVVSPNDSASPDIEMLFGYLWEQSPRSGKLHAGSFLEVLAGWQDEAKEAENELGPAVSADMRDGVRSELVHGIWPTQLPDQRTLEHVARQIGDLLTQVKELKVQGQTGREKLETMLTGRKELDELKVTLQGKTDEEFFEKVEQKLKEILAADQEIEGFAAHSAILAAVEDVKGQLHDLQAMPCARDGYEYLITFGQTQGPLADLIDLLSREKGGNGEYGKYDFDHYTRYARKGKLKAGENFEVFYGKLKADLEEVFQAATCPTEEAPSWVDPDRLDRVRDAIKHMPWADVEITVQLICRRHEFIPSKLQSMPCFKDVFELPPKIKEPMVA